MDGWSNVAEIGGGVKKHHLEKKDTYFYNIFFKEYVDRNKWKQITKQAHNAPTVFSESQTGSEVPKPTRFPSLFLDHTMKKLCFDAMNTEVLGKKAFMLEYHP